MRKILFGLFMVAVVLSSGCRSNKGETVGGTVVGSMPGCNCGH